MSVAGDVCILESHPPRRASVDVCVSNDLLLSAVCDGYEPPPIRRVAHHAHSLTEITLTCQLNAIVTSGYQRLETYVIADVLAPLIVDARVVVSESPTLTVDE